MKNLILLPLLLVSFFCGAAVKRPLPSGKAELKRAESSAPIQEFIPAIEGQSISSGGKTLEINPNGQLILNANGETLARFFYFFTGRNRRTGQGQWIESGSANAYPALKSVLRRENNTFLYEGVMKLDGQEWKQYRQKLTLLPDGLLRFDCEWFPSPDPENELRGHSFWITIPRTGMNGSTLDLSGRSVIVTPEMNNHILGSLRETTPVLTVFKNNAEKEFRISGERKKELGGLNVFCFKDHVRISVQELPKTRRLRFYLDLRRGTAKKESPDILAGIHFKRIENLEMPDRSSRNLLRNPSFEQGFHEYFLFFYGYDPIPDKWKRAPFEIDTKEAFDGEKSLKIHILNDPEKDFRSLRKAANLSASPVILEAGIYTCSFYAKSDTPDAYLNLWASRFRSGSVYGSLRNAMCTVRPGKVWKRYSFTFEVNLPKPVILNMNAVAPSKQGSVHIDAIQIERGEKRTEFTCKVVQGELLSSAPDHFISAKSPIQAKLRLHTMPDAQGKATVSVKDFFKDELYRQTFLFHADKKGIAELSLPFDGKLGKGIFMIRTDYELSDGRSCYDQHRLTVADFLENKHPLKRLFAKQYGGTDLDQPDFLRLADRLRKVGIGSETHSGRNEKIYRDAYRSFGIEPIDGTVYNSLYANGRKKVGFAILKQKPFRDYPQMKDSANILIRDFYLDAKGKITPEYLKRLRQVVASYVSAHPWIPVWGFGYEVFAGFPVSWWSKKNDPEEAAAKFALILKAFAEGVREANPSAKIYQDQPCNMSPESGIAETDRLLAACGKLGLKFDMIGFHPYRFSPENPDLDADTQTVFKMMKKHGYSDSTPLYWGEMMHWGPYNIPQWGTCSSSWRGTPVTWPAHCTLSYDMGWTEKLSAAWRARAWLVALKYAERVLCAQSGNTNNFALDYLYTPRASQMVSNTLGNILGDAQFRKDIRFAPYIRAYVFEDAKKRPVAAVWCHKESVDDGSTDAPVAEADFGTILESVIDLMNQERRFSSGKIRFPVMSAPLFLRGKPGTLAPMTAALEQAFVISGEGISPLQISANPVAPDRVKIRLKNFLSTDFRGKLDHLHLKIPGSKNSEIELPLPRSLSADRIVQEEICPVIVSERGTQYRYDLSFRGTLLHSVPEDSSLENIDWSRVPAIPLENYYRNRNDSAFHAVCRTAWNRQGLYFEISVTDPVFVHQEFPGTANRWDNDSLQIYFDPLADARSREVRGYDDNDYEYAVYPNAAGNSSIVWRVRTADQQLGLGIYAPKENTVATDIPSSFIRTRNGYRYRIFFPAKYLLPADLSAGKALGIGIMVNNVNDSTLPLYKRRRSALSNTTGGMDCHQKPHLWPVYLLWK